MDEARDRAHFNRWSTSYEQSWIQRYLVRLHDVMLNQLVVAGPAPHILDVGCGTGRLLRKAASRWPAARLTGVDPSEGMIDQARRLTPEANFHVAPAAQLPFPAASVDVVVSSVSLHHWPDKAAGVRELARVLRPGGRMILADVAIPGWLTWLHRSGKQSAVGLRRLVADAGLLVRGQQRELAGLVVVITADKAAV